MAEPSKSPTSLNHSRIAPNCGPDCGAILRCNWREAFSPETFRPTDVLRARLCQLEAGSKNTPVDQIALAYYLARLEHVNEGAWVERFNKSAGSWEWFKWDK